MSRRQASLVQWVATLGVCTAAALSAAEIDSTSNSVFDLYFFGNDEAGMFGAATGNALYDDSRKTSGHVSDSSAHYWTTELKQAMQRAVNTWTSAISTPYDTDKHSRKLRIGFFLDDASESSSVMGSSMAGYAATKTVVTRFEPQYGTRANIYSVAEWAWRDNRETANYTPSGLMEDAYWESNILADGSTSIDIAIVLNPVITGYGFDAQGQYYRTVTNRTTQEMQNIATHEIGHGMGMNSNMYTQVYDPASATSVARLSGYVSTWDSLITLNGEYIIAVENGEIITDYVTLSDLQAAGWECEEGKDPLSADSYTFNEIQYDPERRLSLDGEIGVHIAARMLEGDTMEHLSRGNGDNVLGPGGTANSAFSANDLRALELLGWSVDRSSVPEPATGMLTLLGLSTLSLRRRRG